MAQKNVAVLADFVAARSDFREGKRSPRDYLEECISNIERSESSVKAFAHLDIEKARTAADEATARYRENKSQSPIDGMPIGVKDIIDTVDMPTQMNNAYFDKFTPRADAACVRATAIGGGVMVGKTVTTEFAIGRSGPTANPHNINHTPGGSSSGSAAGSAAGMFVAGFGTQTQGSIIRPASFNGVVGFKPTLGSLSTDGVHPLSRTHDHLGALGQSVDAVWALCRWVGEIAPGQDSNGLGGNADGELLPVKPARVAVPRTHGLTELDAESAAQFEKQIVDLRKTGIVVVESDDDPYLADLTKRLDNIINISIRMVAFDMRWPYQSYLAKAPEKMGQRIHELVKLGAEVTLDEYRLMRQERDDLRRRVNELGRSYDAIVLPAASGPAPEGFEYTGARTLLLYGSFLGLPAFSLPLMSVRALPLGLQILGLQGFDHDLAQNAKWLLREFA